MASSKICPERGSEKCARIIYGLPVPTEKLLEQLRSTRVVLGGPVKDEYSPQWKCQDCGAEVYEERMMRHIQPRSRRRKGIWSGRDLVEAFGDERMSVFPILGA